MNKTQRARRILFSALRLTIILLPVLGCNNDPDPSLSSKAKKYLNDIMDIMQSNSINRKTIDWPSFREHVMSEAGAAQSIRETSGAIRLALKLLGDNHSFVLTANKEYILSNTLHCTDVPVTDNISTPENIGYVQVTGFSGSGTEANNFAKSIQDQIQSQDNINLKGWIVDLRGNGGGNMWPMLAGIGPVLGTGTVGYFINPEGGTFSWAYNSNGTSTNSGHVIASVAQPYTLITPAPKVAVLTDNFTASSGEAIVVAFIGRPNTRSFGRATCGVSTANLGYNLSDGAVLYLTVSTMADRNKKMYGSSIVPDEILASTDDIVRAATWINE